MISTEQMSFEANKFEFTCEASDLGPGLPPLKTLPDGKTGIDILHQGVVRTFVLTHTERREGDTLWWDFKMLGDFAFSLKIFND